MCLIRKSCLSFLREHRSHCVYHTRDEAKADVFYYIELFYNRRRRPRNRGRITLMMGMEAFHTAPILPPWGRLFLNAPMVDDFPQEAFALNSKQEYNCGSRLGSTWFSATRSLETIPGSIVAKGLGKSGEVCAITQAHCLCYPTEL